MLKKYHLKAMVAVSAGMLALCSLKAEEKTGRAFNELVQELNEELETAKNKVEKLEEERIATRKAKPEASLRDRGEALKELGKYTREMDRADTPEEKKETSQKVEGQVLKVAELSADFLETLKNDVVTQDKQLEVIEDSLSDVIIKMDKLEKLAAISTKDGVSPELARFRARKNLHSLAQMVEMLAEKNKNTAQWGHVRRTIMLQDGILRRSSLATDKIQKLLEEQKKVYEQVLAQVSIARRGLQTEKEALAQIGLGEIAKSMLRKAAGLLMGSQSIGQIGQAAFMKSEQRQQRLLAFLEQDKDAGGTYSGMNSVSGDSAFDAPQGYKEYLAQGVQQ